MRLRYALLLGVWASSIGAIRAQDDLLGLLNEGAPAPEKEPVTAIFKGTKVINGQSPELPAPGVMQFMILHRFGAFSDDFFYNFFGLDNAEIRLSLEYAPVHWLSIGGGRSSFQKTYDGFAKYRIMRQSTGSKGFPLSIVGYSTANVQTLRWQDGLPHNESERWTYSHQLVLARKFSDRFSLAVTPSLVHFNVVERADDPNDVIAIGFGGRFKLNQRISFNAEYFPQLNPAQYGPEGQRETYQNSLSLGFDIETGGHVFQLFFTNSRGLNDPSWIARTPGEWGQGDVYFGFNISRVFTVKPPKLPEG
ncbi:hypothetical protein GC167_09010 [bacterium]|nr:hypothetical protein [bacterium]